ncbi:hypothetical protein B0H13DRAFT_2318901 [Mycena leptocephala]|nr:hypothetical protein B0H13DRAFT_2318901 [Mycena leptocephala]
MPPRSKTTVVPLQPTADQLLDEQIAATGQHTLPLLWYFHHFATVAHDIDTYHEDLEKSILQALPVLGALVTAVMKDYLHPTCDFLDWWYMYDCLLALLGSGPKDWACVSCLDTHMPSELPADFKIPTEAVPLEREHTAPARRLADTQNFEQDILPLPPPPTRTPKASPSKISSPAESGGPSTSASASKGKAKTSGDDKVFKGLQTGSPPSGKRTVRSQDTKAAPAKVDETSQKKRKKAPSAKPKSPSPDKESEDKKDNDEDEGEDEKEGGKTKKGKMPVKDLNAKEFGRLARSALERIQGNCKTSKRRVRSHA